MIEDFDSMVKSAFLDVLDAGFVLRVVDGSEVILCSESGVKLHVSLSRDGADLGYVESKGVGECYLYNLGLFLAVRCRGASFSAAPQTQRTLGFSEMVRRELKWLAQLLLEKGQDVLRGETEWIEAYPCAPTRLRQDHCSRILGAARN